MEEFDITPLPHVFLSMLNSGMEAAPALSELVDNSLDALATRVDVYWDHASKLLTVKDDGVGTNPERIVHHGASDREGRNTSGRFGVGAVDAITAFSPTAEIMSIRAGIKRLVHVDFAQCVHRPRALRESPVRVPESLHGTTINIMGVQKNIRIPQLIQAIARTFAPALRHGRVIAFNGSELIPPALPELEMRREGRGVFDGKRYEWFAGMLPAASDEAGGWRFDFHHRELKQTPSNRSYGCGSKNIMRFYGRVTLHEDDGATGDGLWTVDKHKQSVQRLEELCETIAPQIEDILDHADNQYTLEIEAEIAGEVSEMLSQAMRKKKKEKRSRGDGGTGEGAKPANTGRRRTRATQTQDGEGSVIDSQGEDAAPGEPKRDIQPFNIVFTPTATFAEVLGNRKASTVYFGKQHKYWQHYSQNRDVVMAWAMAMLAGYAVTCEDEGQAVMRFVSQHDGAAKTFFETAGEFASWAKLPEMEEV